MNPLDLVKLSGLMKLTSGKPEVVIGLLDGPVTGNHANLSSSNIQKVQGRLSHQCLEAKSFACIHGTFVAGILCGNRGSVAPAICPNCTLLVRSIFTEAVTEGQMTSTTPEDLAEAIAESIDAGARILNMSIALAQPSSQGQRQLEEVLDYAAKRGVLVVAASGNQGTLGSSVITRHAWVIPVIACDLRGIPLSQSNLGNSIGRRGLNAPGDRITSFDPEGQPLVLGGTSVAVPFVTGTIALLWSEFPTATAAEIKLAVTQAEQQRRTTVVPPLLNAWRAYQWMKRNRLPGEI
jgi:subtilisin family serine protease